MIIARCKIQQISKYAIAVSIIAVIFVFFIQEFQLNWYKIHNFKFKFDMLYIFLAVGSVVVNYLLTTYSWYFAINTLSAQKITFTESVATVNTSNLTKYIPGKVWSYALQAFWLEKKGFPKSLIVFVNIINTYALLAASVIVSLLLLSFSPKIAPLYLVVLMLGVFLVLDAIFVCLNPHLVRISIRLLNRIFKCDMYYYETSKKLFLQLHAINFVSALCFGSGACFLCSGIGIDINGANILLIMSSMIISDVIGFIALIVPGGVGVREGVMYLMLSGVSTAVLALILPIATRIVSMLVDVLLGAIGFMLLKKISSVKK